MIDPKKLLEGMDIKIVSRDEAFFDGARWPRRQIERWLEPPFDSDSSMVLGWRVILALMDEFDDGNYEVAKEPGRRTAPRCDRHGTVMQRNSYRGPNDSTEWVCADCEKQKERKPTWEPGTVVKGPDGLRWLVEKQKEEYRWVFRDADGELQAAELRPEYWKAYRLPHEFKPGDWFEDSNFPGKVFKVTWAEVACVHSAGGLFHEVRVCRHTPAPKPEPFAGSHWRCMDELDPYTKLDLAARDIDLRRAFEQLEKRVQQLEGSK